MVPFLPVLVGRLWFLEVPHVPLEADLREGCHVDLSLLVDISEEGGFVDSLWGLERGPFECESFHFVCEVVVSLVVEFVGDACEFELVCGDCSTRRDPGLPFDVIVSFEEVDEVFVLEFDHSSTLSPAIQVELFLRWFLGSPYHLESWDGFFEFFLQCFECGFIFEPVVGSECPHDGVLFEGGLFDFALGFFGEQFDERFDVVLDVFGSWLGVESGFNDRFW